MKISELRELSSDELTQKLLGLKREWLDLRMAAAAGKLDKPHRIGQIRKDLARLHTLLKERERPLASK